MEDKVISKSTYIWSHVAVIVFHISIGILLILAQKKVLFEEKSAEIAVYTIGGLLIVISLLAIVPIAKQYSTITIE
jgi:hypothetical protein